MIQLFATTVIIGFLGYIFFLDGDKSKIGFKKKEKSKASVTTPNAKGSNIKNTQNSLPFLKIRANGNAESPALILKDKDTYVGVVEIFGVNYNLLSTGEKLVLEEVFQRTLNGLDYPVQIYIQSRKIDLDSYNILYTKRLDELKENLKNEQGKVVLLINKQASQKELNAAKSDVNRIISQIEYGENIVNFINQFASNSDILDKKYFISTPYHYDASQFNIKQNDDEKYATAFNTIINRLESILMSLNGANMEGKILNGIELSELLYTSFNKPDSDKYKLGNAVNSGFANHIITSRPVEYKIIEDEKRKIKEEYERELSKVV